MAYDEGTLAQTGVLALTPNGTEGSVWDTGGMSADASGNLYATVANGTFDTTLDGQGMPDQQDFGNAALKISTSAATLSVKDYFTPYDTAAESANDVDFGSGSMLLLVDQTDDSGTMHQLLIAGGKNGNLYVIDRNDMGRFNASADQVYESVPVGGSLFSAPVYFNGNVYVCDAGGTLKAYTFSNAMLPQSPSSQTSTTFPFPGTSPAISAQDTGNAILWALESAPGSAAVLYAYNPADLAQEYYDSRQAAGGRDSFGNGGKFITPVIANGKVFVGTPNGVAVFGLL
jgi:PQQ-like domain